MSEGKSRLIGQLERCLAEPAWPYFYMQKDDVALCLEALKSTRTQSPSPELVENIRTALSWIEPPFITAETLADELRNRISFCLADAERALTAITRTPDRGSSNE